MLGLFRTREHRITVNQGQPLVVTSKETLLHGALRHGLSLPYSCKVGGCGTCKCRLIEGTVRELTDTSYLLTKQELRDNVILACQSAPRSDVVVEFAGWQGSARDVAGRIAAVKPLTHDISEVTVALDEAVSFEAGQYARVQAASTDIPARCYSFAHRCPPRGATRISFFVRAIEGGRMSSWLVDAAHVGHDVTVTGSLGDFSLRDDDRPAVFVAGGSGLAPVLAVLEQAVADDARVVNRTAVLLFGVRAQRDLYATDRIAAVQAAWRGRFVFEPVLSAEPEASDWTGLRGLVPERVAHHAVPEASGYLCGPPPMVDAAVAQMEHAGLALHRIHFDRFADQTGGGAR